ncbi:FxsA family protein [Sulfurimonas sp.]|nr:FxsA family protein [Sulfurimonas sp.]
MLYFITYIFFEVLVSTNIASLIGSLATFLEIIVSAFFGISILVNFRKTLAENMTAVSYSCIDLEQFQRLNLFTILGGILLVIPGFLTDIFGVLLQFSAFTTMAVNRYNMKFGKCDTNFKSHNKKDSDVIDVEVISDNTINK